MKQDIYEVFNRANIDLDRYDVQPLSEVEQERMKRNVMEQMKQQKNSGNKRSRRPWGAVAAVAVCVAMLSQTAFAQEMWGQLVKQVQLDGNVTISHSEVTPEDVQEILSNPDLMEQIIKSNEGVDESMVLHETDQSKLADMLCFTPLFPETLPEGYAFDHANLFKNDDGTISDKYLHMYYLNGDDEIFIEERYLDEETAFSTGTDGELREVEVCGVKGALDETSITWVKDGICYTVIGHELSQAELMELANSMA